MTPTDLLALLGAARIDLLGQLALATLLGGLIGLEREMSGKPAGLRTNILICVGATLITDISVSLGVDLGDTRADAGRLAAQIVSGIGFLGAGTIIQAKGTVTGLTSAATLWVVAAIGIAIGARHFPEAVVTGSLVLAVLLPLGRFERRVSERRGGRTVVFEMARTAGGAKRVVDLAIRAGLKVRSEHVEIKGNRLRGRMEFFGSPAAWQTCREALISDPEVLSLELL